MIEFGRFRTAALLSLLILAVAVPASAELVTSHEKAVNGYPDLVRRSVEFWSDGTRLAGDITYPKGLKAGEKLPCIVLCHGWGGKKSHLNIQIGPMFAQAGYVVFTFDYRGWGESDSRLVMLDPMPKPGADGKVTVTALAIRELVDPLDQQEDIDAALSFVEGESIVDADRIGIWGSSFGGGHVIWRAAHDRRVKCVVSQVGAMDQRLGLIRSNALAKAQADKIKRARGEIPPVPLGDDKPEGLVGSPYYDRFMDFVPVDYTDRITVPVMIIDAELEHYFDNRDHGQRVYEKLVGRVPVEFHEFKGMKHYDVYSKNLKDAMALEIPWFDKYLKGE